jgi:RNA polymerase sigma factor (sigma-70 family)
MSTPAPPIHRRRAGVTMSRFPAPTPHPTLIPTAPVLVGKLDEPFDPATWSWDQIVRAHRGDVYRHAYRLTRNPHDADDLTQDVFVRVFRALPNYQPGGSFPGWLHRITTNLFRDRLRGARRMRFDPLGDDEDRIIDREPTPADLMDERTLGADLVEALRALPLPFRSVVVLRDVRGLSYDQVATALGISIGTVRSRLHRGRARLRIALSHRAPNQAVPAYAEVRAA